MQGFVKRAAWNEVAIYIGKEGPQLTAKGLVCRYSEHLIIERIAYDGRPFASNKM
jgi:hypothetical protein